MSTTKTEQLRQSFADRLHANPYLVEELLTELDAASRIDDYNLLGRSIHAYRGDFQQIVLTWAARVDTLAAGEGQEKAKADRREEKEP